MISCSGSRRVLRRVSASPPGAPTAGNGAERHGRCGAPVRAAGGKPRAVAAWRCAHLPIGCSTLFRVGRDPRAVELAGASESHRHTGIGIQCEPGADRPARETVLGAGHDGAVPARHLGREKRTHRKCSSDLTDCQFLGILHNAERDRSTGPTVVPLRGW